MIELADGACGPLVAELRMAEESIGHMREALDTDCELYNVLHGIAVKNGRGMQTRDVVVSAAALAALVRFQRMFPVNPQAIDK